ncbi:hypothetical protein VYU27_007736 [Nannochloropsis oceanica]
MLRALDPVQGHMESLSMHMHGVDPASPPPACYHCLWGHILPGAYLLFRSFLLILEAISLRQPKRFSPRTLGRLRAYSSLIAGPFLAMGEGITHKAWHAGNLQHFSIYLLIFMDGLVAWMCLVGGRAGGRKGERRLWPMSLLGVWEGGMLGCVGWEMVSHFHGGALITQMHAMMFPLLSLAATVLVVERVVMRGEREGLRLAGAVAMAWVGCWFSLIGPGFWWEGGREGWLGKAYDEVREGGEKGVMEGHEVLMWSATLLTFVFVVAFLGVGVVWLVMGGGREGGEEEEEEEEWEDGGRRGKRGAYTELEMSTTGDGGGFGGRGRGGGGGGGGGRGERGKRGKEERRERRRAVRAWSGTEESEEEGEGDGQREQGREGGKRIISDEEEGVVLA